MLKKKWSLIKFEDSKAGYKSKLRNQSYSFKLFKDEEVFPELHEQKWIDTLAQCDKVNSEQDYDTDKE